MRNLGIVTIGQTPRVDLVPEIQKILGEDVNIIEKGALDGLTLKEVEALYPEKDDEVLVTRMADGTEVKVAERHIFPKLKTKIKNLEDEGLKIILIACTGKFPTINCSSLIVRPQEVLFHVVSSVTKNLALGVITPDELQVDSAKERWSSVASKVVIESGSPYTGIDKISEAAKKLTQSGVDIVVMDCIGYTLGMKEIVSQITNRPVILARSITTRVLKELL